MLWQVTGPGANTPSGHVTGESTGPDGSPIVNVTPPVELSSNAQLGKKFFDVKCAACHGENAAGTNGLAPPLVHTFYKPGHHGDGAFLNAAANGVQAHHWKFGNMPPVTGINAGEVKMIVRYIRELQLANGIN